MVDMWDDELLERMIEDEYFNETRDVECTICGVRPGDLSDELMVNQGWLAVFSYNETRLEWLCIGCNDE